MGKLLKLIAQEEFEKDPYHIRNRAVKLFKRYAQLPTSIEKNETESAMLTESVPHELPRQAFASMTISTEESQDFQSLRAENAKLKQKIKVSFFNKQHTTLFFFFFLPDFFFFFPS